MIVYGDDDSVKFSDSKIFLGDKRNRSILGDRRSIGIHSYIAFEDAESMLLQWDDLFCFGSS